MSNIVLVKTDSQLIANHKDKNYQAKDPKMKWYLALSRAMHKHFGE